MAQDSDDVCDNRNDGYAPTRARSDADADSASYDRIIESDPMLKALVKYRIDAVSNPHVGDFELDENGDIAFFEFTFQHAKRLLDPISRRELDEHEGDFVSRSEHRTRAAINEWWRRRLLVEDHDAAPLPNNPTDHVEDFG